MMTQLSFDTSFFRAASRARTPGDFSNFCASRREVYEVHDFSEEVLDDEETRRTIAGSGKRNKLIGRLTSSLCRAAAWPALAEFSSEAFRVSVRCGKVELPRFDLRRFRSHFFPRDPQVVRESVAWVCNGDTRGRLRERCFEIHL